MARPTSQVGDAARLSDVAAVGVVVDVADGLLLAQQATAGVDHVDQHGVARVQPAAEVHVAEAGPCRVQACGTTTNKATKISISLSFFLVCSEGKGY